jgi:hypothetical protein
MSWKFVFDANKRTLPGTNIYDVCLYVSTTGYKFFAFNDRVLFCVDSTKYFVTELRVEDLF